MPLVLALTAMGVVAPRVSLQALLSTCVDACQRGCACIREVEERRAGTTLAVELKVSNDPRSALTEADLAAQHAIVTALRAAWPGLLIIGEEDDSEASKVGSAPAPEPRPLQSDLCQELLDLEPVGLDEICIFVDPLDGTREFVEGRLSRVQSLVGIAVGGRAVGGAIGLPFPSGNLDSSSAVVYGLVGSGVGTLGERGPARGVGDGGGEDLLKRPLVVTGDSAHPVLAAAREAASCVGSERAGFVPRDPCGCLAVSFRGMAARASGISATPAACQTLRPLHPS